MKLATILTDPQLLVTLFRLDADLSDQVKARGCPYCQGPLHQADYERKPRFPIPMDWRSCRRHSLCCGQEGCRRRTMPPSTRFLGRRVYLGILVILVTYLGHGATSRRVDRLTREFDIDPATLARWRQWWREEFPATSFWHRHQAGFFILTSAGQEPLVMLVKHYLIDPGHDPPTTEAVHALLLFLAPLAASVPAF
jgi:hypothetical protein